MMVAHSLSHDTLAVARRTVSAGSPRSAAFRRWLAPLTLANSTSPTTCTVTARRGRQDAGNSTWVVRQPRQRPRRGLSWVVPSWPRTDRRRAYPHGASRCPHDGHASPAPESTWSASLPCLSIIKVSWAPHSLSLPDPGTRRQGQLVLQRDPIPAPAQPPSLRSRRTTKTVPQHLNPPSQPASPNMTTGHDHEPWRHSPAWWHTESRPTHPDRPPSVVAVDER